MNPIRNVSLVIKHNYQEGGFQSLRLPSQIAFWLAFVYGMIITASVIVLDWPLSAPVSNFF